MARTTTRQTQKAIIRKDAKIGEVVVFNLETMANKGHIWCNGITYGNSVWSGSEATLDYYHSTQKATKEEVAEARQAMLETYDVELDVKQRLQQKYLDEIWSN